MTPGAGGAPPAGAPGDSGADALARVRRAYDRDPEREWARLAGGAQARLEHLVTAHALERWLPPPAGRRPVRVLDAGGGPGRYTLELAARGYAVTLLDLSPGLLALARERTGRAPAATRRRVEAIVEGTITDLSAFPDGAFDAVLCVGGPLSHLTDPAAQRAALAELRRVARPGGRLFVSGFNRLAAYRSVVQWPACWDQFLPGLLDSGLTTIGREVPAYAFLPEELVGLVAGAGLTVERLVGCQGLGAHLPEDHLLALMADPARWPVWRDLLLATCDRPDIVGVSSHLLAVAARAPA